VLRERRWHSIYLVSPSSPQTRRPATNFSDKERKEMLSVIAPHDPSKHQETALKLRQPGTGVWFTEGPHFKSWLETPNAKMWLYGIRGIPNP
jgi:hypothetical protein